VAVWIEIVGVGQIPASTRVAVVVGDALLDGGVFGLLGVEGVAVEVLFATDLALTGSGIDLEDCVVVTVDVGVEAETKEVLMVVCVDLEGGLFRVGLGHFARVKPLTPG